MSMDNVNIYWSATSSAWILDLWDQKLKIWIKHDSYPSQQEAEDAAKAL
jgi:hypothetical protein